MNRLANGIFVLSLAASLSACSQSGALMGEPGEFLSSASSTHMTIRRDLGGSVVHYALKAKQIREDHRVVRFAGRCDSACTLYLGLPASQTCLLPGATFGFHMPYGASPVENRRTSEYMLASYPAWVRGWISARGGLSSSLKVMSHNYASQYIRSCDEAAA